MQKLLANELLMLLKSSSYENLFSDIYFSYHRSNEHATSNCMELKHKVQDLIDDNIVGLKTSSDSCGEDTSLEQDHVDKPMPSSGSLSSSTSSNIHASPKASNPSKIPSSNMLPNSSMLAILILKGSLLNKLKLTFTWLQIFQ